VNRQVESAHARYRERLAALAAPEFVDAVGEAGKRLGLQAEEEWMRTKERFDPEAEPFATCVYKSVGLPQRLVRAEVFTARPPLRGLDDCVLRAGAAGWLRVTRFPSDPKLPALPTLLAGPGRRTVVRYAPYRRCTIRVDRDGRSRFVKVYADDRGERVHADGLELWRAGRRGELGFAVARPERFDPSTRAVWQSTIRGELITGRLYTIGDEALAHRLGRATASLSRARLRPRAVLDAKTVLARAAGRCAELERRVPQLGHDARRLLAALERVHAAAGPTEPRPVHGALHPSQWLDDGSRLGLVDYDSVALGDPELDAGTFLADMDVQDCERVSIDRVNAAFLTGYETVAGLDEGLLRAYRAHGRLGRAVKVARALRPDGDEKAERRLRGALECIGGAS
jgi:hypothetical protein